MSLKNILFGTINRKLIVIFSIILLVLILTSVVTVYLQVQGLQFQFNSAMVENEEDFLDIQEESTRTLSATLEIILQDSKFKEIYLEKDREKLFEYGQPLFQKLKNEHQITHFYFILPDGTNFVRLHNKSVFGDKINRLTFKKAKFTGNIGTGIELGKTAYALRVVSPYYDGDELIGYVELGQEIDEFLTIMKKGKNDEFALVVNKNTLDEENWASVRKNKGLRNNWDDLEEYVAIENTTDEKFSCFSDNSIEILKEETGFIEKSFNGTETFACGGFALIDASNEKKGVLFSLIDVTSEQAILNNFQMVILATMIFYILIFIGVAIFASRKISKPIKRLFFATKQIEKGNFKTRIKIETDDELEQLGNAFNKTAEALEKMDKEHKQLEHAKTEFLSITSHELRSPMTPMRAQLQMILGEYFGKINPKQRESLDIVLRNTERLDRIIQDFLEISRIEAARLKFKFIKTSLNKPIESLLKEMDGFMPEKKIKLVSHIDNLPIIEVDPDRVMQVLRNLINNAKKFSPDRAEIIVTAKQKKSRIEFSVSDQGVGLSKDDKRRVFEPFYQADQTMYNKQKGNGLGLAICRGIVESQNGKIWIESEKKKGSIFHFTIPLEPVRESKSIKLLFSSSEENEKKVEDLFIDILGPMGANEFKKIKDADVDFDSITDYFREITKIGVITAENLTIANNRLEIIFETRSRKGMDLPKQIEMLYLEYLGSDGDERFGRLEKLTANAVFSDIIALERLGKLNSKQASLFRDKVMGLFRRKAISGKNN